jgi:hypothetical protein
MVRVGCAVCTPDGMLWGCMRISYSPTIQRAPCTVLLCIWSSVCMVGWSWSLIVPSRMVLYAVVVAPVALVLVPIHYMWIGSS